MASESEELIDKNENDGFKFAVLALTTILTLIFTLYIQISINVINFTIESYMLICLLIASLVIYSIYLLVYIISKSIIFELKNYNDKKFDFNKKFPASIYVSGTVIFIICILSTIYITIQELFNGKLHGIFFIIIFPILMIAVHILLLFVVNLYKSKRIRYTGTLIRVHPFFYRDLYLLKSKPKSYYRTLLIILIGVPISINRYGNRIIKILDVVSDFIEGEATPRIKSIGLFFFFILIIYTMSSISLLGVFKGDVNIDLKNIYSKDNEIIPITVTVFGPNSGMKLQLQFLGNTTNQSKSLSNGPPGHLKEEVSLSPKHSTNSTPTIFGVSSGAGEFEFFIPTATLEEGYYKLTFIRPDIGYSYKYFYLTNNYSYEPFV